MHSIHRYPKPAKTVTGPALLALLLALSLAEPGLGQIRPGVERGDYWGDVRARYRSEVLQEVGDLMEDWLTAWNEDDAASITATFSEAGILILDDERAAGPLSIEQLLRAKLSAAGPVQTSLIDFDVRGEMAFATTRFSYAENVGSAERAEASGYLVWILVKEHGSWRLRSQVFVRTEE